MRQVKIGLSKAVEDMNSDWKIKDIIDLEFFFHLDETEREISENSHSIDLRDRDIFLRYANDGNGIIKNRKLMRFWLKNRRKALRRNNSIPAVLPGDVFDIISKSFIVVFTLIGLFSGIGLSGTMMRYDGIQPLNVAILFGVFVIGQILLIMGGMCMSFFPKYNRFLKKRTVILSIVSIFFKKLLMKSNVTHANLSPNSIKSVLGAIKSKQSLYASVVLWPVFILFQLGGVGFNLGVLLVIVIRVLSSDLAFGWQSTIQFSAENIHSFAQWVALPWSSFLPEGIGYPTLHDIEGTKIILKDGIYHLATDNLVSWWPFLWLGIFCYGLLPRVVMLVIGVITLNKRLDAIQFDFADCEKVVLRMTTPELSTHGNTVENIDSQSDAVIIEAEKYTDSDFGVASFVVLISEDIIDNCSQSEITKYVQKNMGGNLHTVLELDDDSDFQHLVEVLKPLSNELRPAKILMIQEAWLPPITETLHLIKDMREAVGNKMHIIIGLIGRPQQGHFFTTVDDSDRLIWYQRIKELGDPYLQIDILASGG